MTTYSGFLFKWLGRGAEEAALFLARRKILVEIVSPEVPLWCQEEFVICDV